MSFPRREIIKTNQRGIYLANDMKVLDHGSRVFLVRSVIKSRASTNLIIDNIIINANSDGIQLNDVV